MLSKLIELAEKGLIPDFMIRAGIVRNCKNRLRNESSFSKQELDAKKQKWVEQMKESPIALVPEKANEQHYEVPPSFFEEALGSNLKYSSGYWPSSETTLDQSEVSMLELSCKRAELKDGQNILELGCGWGSLTCFMASQYPNNFSHDIKNMRHL